MTIKELGAAAQQAQDDYAAVRAWAEKRRAELDAQLDEIREQYAAIQPAVDLAARRDTDAKTALHAAQNAARETDDELSWLPPGARAEIRWASLAKSPAASRMQEIEPGVIVNRDTRIAVASARPWNGKAQPNPAEQYTMASAAAERAKLRDEVGLGQAGSEPDCSLPVMPVRPM